MIDRRSLVATLAAMPLAKSALAQNGTITDSAGRPLPRLGRVARILPAGPPAAVLLYTLAPDLLAGWPRAPSAEEKRYLRPDVAARPETGRITGRGNTANLEAVLGARPDLILDVGSVAPTYVSLADRVQEQTGIPYTLFDGSLIETPAIYRRLGQLIGRPERGDDLARRAAAILSLVDRRVSTVPSADRPKVYYARGPQGLETGLAGSINVESIGLMGARNVAADQPGAGLATVSLEQVLAWDPDVIVTIDPAFAASVRTMPGWRSVAAVRNGRVHLAPRLPFGWIDFPPSVNRLIGLPWLGGIFYPGRFDNDLIEMTRDFYAAFYGAELSADDAARILAG